MVSLKPGSQQWHWCCECHMRRWKKHFFPTSQILINFSTIWMVGYWLTLVMQYWNRNWVYSNVTPVLMVPAVICEPDLTQNNKITSTNLRKIKENTVNVHVYTYIIRHIVNRGYSGREAIWVTIQTYYEWALPSPNSPAYTVTLDTFFLQNAASQWLMH